MNWIADTLWDLLRIGNRSGMGNRESAAGTRERKKSANQNPVADSGRKPIQQRYDALVAQMKQEYGFRVRKWRSSMTGCAWQVAYDNGQLVRLLEAPYPRGPMSCAVFLHEVGHHAIGFRTYSPRCLEEYHAWVWSLNAMRAHGFNVTAAVEKRMAESLHYAVAKARRRGLKRLPVELEPYLAPRTRVLSGS